jgi:hypothetical protein
VVVWWCGGVVVGGVGGWGGGVRWGLWWYGSGGVVVWGVGVSPCARTFQGLHSVRLWTPTILKLIWYLKYQSAKWYLKY